MVNHVCQEPTCIGGQTYNSATHTCDAPICGDGYTENQTTHQCEFTGCQPGFKQGKINGVTACIPSGETTQGTSESTNEETSSETSESTTTQNPDGTTTTTTTTTTTGTGTTRTEITLDTSGLAQESTMNDIREHLSDLGKEATAGDLASAPDSFYTSAYPDGITGIWDSHKTALDQTAFAQAVDTLTPDLGGSGGVAPSWTLDLGNLGSFELQPPVYVWDFLRICFIVTALFYARSLIFGG